MILTGKLIKEFQIVHPHEERTSFRGMTYGESFAGYDLRVNLDEIWKGHNPNSSIDLDPDRMLLVPIFERIVMPNNVVGMLYNKSSLLRKGLTIAPAIIEPGWCGHLTIGLFNQSPVRQTIRNFQPVVHAVFQYLHGQAVYEGEYQDQGKEVVAGKKEKK